MSGRGRRRARRGAAGAAAIAALIPCLAAGAHAADAPASAAEQHWLTARGYVNARYLYVGLSHSPNVLSTVQITGSLEASAFSNRLVFKYRSHSWIDLEHTRKSFLESPFQDRHVIQTISLEADRLAAGVLDLKIGRFFPDVQYGNSPVIDGGALTARTGRFSLSGSAGRAVDLWNGSHESSDLAATGQLRYRGDRMSASVGYQHSSAVDFEQNEAPAGISVTLKKTYWLEAYAGYDFSDKHVARAGASASWRRGAGSLSISATQWRSPFDQLYVLAKGQSVAPVGLDSKSVPSTYDDVRLSGSYARSSWSVRGSGSAMAGVRSGWTANGYLMTPALFGVRCEVGIQGMRTDYVEFVSYDLTLTGSVGTLGIQAQSQTRQYRWLPTPTGERVLDNYTELSLDYPLVKHVYASGAAGVFFRKFGDESFQPQAEIRLIARL